MSSQLLFMIFFYLVLYSKPKDKQGTSVGKDPVRCEGHQKAEVKSFPVMPRVVEAPVAFHKGKWMCCLFPKQGRGRGASSMQHMEQTCILRLNHLPLAADTKPQFTQALSDSNVA